MIGTRGGTHGHRRKMLMRKTERHQESTAGQSRFRYAALWDRNPPVIEAYNVIQRRRMRKRKIETEFCRKETLTMEKAKMHSMMK